MAGGNSEGERWGRDANVLSEIGRYLDSQGSFTVQVRLPRRLAQEAVAAWERDDDGPSDPDGEPLERLRRAAGTLALLGLELSGHELGSADEITVDLPVHLVGNALQAAWDDV